MKRRFVQERGRQSYATPSAREEQQGQATVEFALVFIIFAFIVMGIFDFGRGVAAYNAISHAAREGARMAIHSPGPPDYFQTGRNANIVAEVRNRTAMLPADDITVAISPEEESARTSGVIVTVQVSYEFTPVTPLISAVLPGGKITMSASGKSVVQ